MFRNIEMVFNPKSGIEISRFFLPFIRYFVFLPNIKSYETYNICQVKDFGLETN